MTREQISNAVGGICAAYIQEALEPDGKSECIRYRRPAGRRVLAIAAALVLLCALAIPTMAAADVSGAYALLYVLSPELAQRLKPVRMSCEDNGIRMEVLSACISGTEAEIYISMQDLTGERIDETVDLFDSYSINTPFSCSASCQRVSFDAQTGVATFLIYITQWSEQQIQGDKITFQVRQLLNGTQEYEGIVEGVDLSQASPVSQTQQDMHIRGGGGQIDWDNVHCLIPSADAVALPVDGVSITAMGFVDGRLHIQLYFESIGTDDHGYVYFLDGNGERIGCKQSIAFWDAEQRGSYEEFVFDVTPQELEELTLYGHFWTGGVLTDGNWQVTFPIESA